MCGGESRGGGGGGFLIVKGCDVGMNLGSIKLLPRSISSSHLRTTSGATERRG